jgi:hypothetical protein
MGTKGTMSLSGKVNIAIEPGAFFSIENGPFRTDDRELAPHALEGNRKIPI